MELRQYVALLWKWAWLIVLCAVLAAVPAYVLTKRQPTLYRATTALLISQASSVSIEDLSALTSGARLATTYAQLLTKRPVMQEVARKLDLPLSAAALVHMVSVSVVGDTQLLNLRVVDTDPARAQDIANTLPVVFMEQNEAIQLTRYSSSKENLRKELELVDTDIKATQASLDVLRASPTPDAVETSRVEAALLQYRTTYANLLRSYEDIRLAEARALDTVTVVEPAVLASVAPRTMTNTMLAAVVGAVVAVAAALLIEYLDDTVKSPQDVERTTNLPTFGVVVRFPGAEVGEGPVTAVDPKSGVAEGYRVLRFNVQFAAMRMAKSGAVLLVTSAQPMEGKTTSLANLGVSLAQAGKRVLLVDTDLRRPSLHKHFNLSKEAGLTTLLLEQEADIERIVQKTAVEGLRVLPSGRLPANPAEVLGFAEFGALLERLRGMADYVLLDSPPVLSVVDASVLAQKADGVLMVVEAGQTRTDMFARAVAALQGAKAQVLGAILNKVSVRRGGDYYDYYYYYSSYYSEEEGGGRKKKRRHTRGGPFRRLGRAIAKLFGRWTEAHAPVKAEEVVTEVPVGTPPSGVFAPAGRTAPRVPATAPRVLGGVSGAGAPVVEVEGPPAEEVVAEVSVGTPPRVPAIATASNPELEATASRVLGGTAPRGVGGVSGAGAPALEVEALPKAEEAVAEVPVGTPPRGVGGVGTPPSGVFAPAGRTAPRAPGTPPRALGGVYGADADAVYAQAMEHYRGQEWPQARDALYRLKAMDPARPDVDALLNDVERVMKHDRPRQRAKRQASETVLGTPSSVLHPASSAGRVSGTPSRVLGGVGGGRRPRVRLGQVVVLVLVLLSATAGALMYAGVLPMPRLSALFRGNQVQTYINRGYDFFIGESYEEAIQSFNKALELDPNNAEAQLGLEHATQYLAIRDLYGQARALMAQNSFDAAIVKLETIVKTDPWYKDADLLLSQCQRSQELEGLYEQAMGYYNAGDWAKAADAFEGLRGKGAAAGETEISSKLFDCYLNEGRQQIAAAGSRSAIIRATQIFNSALALSPNDLVAQEERQLASLYLDGYTAYERIDWRQAIANLSRICAARPDYAAGQAARLLCASYTKLGDSYQANGQPQLALDQYRLVQTFAQCDQTVVSGKIQQVLALLGPATPSPTATP